jgi:hypothetical protein
MLDESDIQVAAASLTAENVGSLRTAIIKVYINVCAMLGKEKRSLA